MQDFFEKQRPTLSFEIFPPKGKASLDKVFETVDALASLAPDLISVTYGAGGTSRDNTVEIASKIQNSYNIPALAHLSCVGSTREDIARILAELKEKGVKNILALRGDLAEGETLKDFHYAADLVRFIRQGYDFNVYAACYPEKHIEAVSMDDDLRYLKEKVDCGVNALISQLFFDNRSFYEFRDRARALGVRVPIVAGIMPITSAKQIDRMVSMCGATVPDSVQRFIKAFGHNSMAMKEAGVAHATEQIVDLLATGVDGIHIYTMNLPSITKQIAENIRGILYALRVKRG
jgi:methylenetetrahydrofolate reductase (NADPH)